MRVLQLCAAIVDPLTVGGKHHRDVSAEGASVQAGLAGVLGQPVQAAGSSRCLSW
jgi:hypothetical protein